MGTSTRRTDLPNMGNLPGRSGDRGTLSRSRSGGVRALGTLRPSAPLRDLVLAQLALEVATAAHVAELVDEQERDRVHHEPAELEELEPFRKRHGWPGPPGISAPARSRRMKSRSASSTSSSAVSAGACQRTACTPAPGVNRNESSVQRTNTIS